MQRTVRCVLILNSQSTFLFCLAPGTLKIQINDGPMMDLIDQSNDDFKISNAEKFTYVVTWFGVDVTFERRRPGKMMLIKTYLQPFWQTRVQEKV